MIKAEIVLDSINPIGNRLTAFVVTLPWYISPELLRHRCFSFCSASARAVPSWKLLKAVWDDPVVPVYWGLNEPGMQANKEMLKHRIWIAKGILRFSWITSLISSWLLSKVGCHKQTSNRYVAPHAYITLIVSGTEWANFFNLRCHPAAQPEMKQLACQMLKCYIKSIPKALKPGEQHVPFAEKYADGLNEQQKLQVSVARCARVSYLNHDGTFDHKKDFQLCEKLLESKHMSPFEFQAECLPNAERSGNLIGWRQYRQTIPGQCQEEFDANKLLISMLD